MKNHNEIMQIYHAVIKQLEQKITFRKKMDKNFQLYEFYTLKNIIDIEEKTDKVIRDNIVHIANESMKKTDLYYFLEKKDTGALISLIESTEFQYDLYYIDQYHNLLKDIINAYWKPEQKAEQLISLLIEKGIQKYPEKTKKIMEDIIQWYENWSKTIEKQLLHYNLENNLKNKRQSIIPKKNKI